MESQIIVADTSSLPYMLGEKEHCSTAAFKLLPLTAGSLTKALK